ncbi:MAG: polysaccharide deacetylase family protein, partial [Elusimicrobiota bacterium]|nr:polysaccharide deacetylase family protein [Elusimicrobiota bacterium]
ISRKSEMELRSLPFSPGEFKEIALTFDDGPDPKATPKILNMLNKEGVKATFFVVGKMVEKYPELLTQVWKEGHDVGNHTYNHPDLTRLSKEDILKELDKTRILVRKITGKDTYLFRPPGGRYDNKVIVATTLSGYKMILWTDYPGDYGCPSSRLIYQRTVSTAENEGIILLHNGLDPTVDALPKIISELKKRKYRFVTISDLMEEIRAKESVYFEKFEREQKARPLPLEMAVTE